MNKPKRPCKKPSCSNLTDRTYCHEHSLETQNKASQRHKDYDTHKRDKDSDAFYKSKPWKRLRLQALSRDNYLCVHCLANKKIRPADAVDHIYPIKGWWQLRLTLDNLQCLCHGCHTNKTAEDKRKGWCSMIGRMARCDDGCNLTFQILQLDEEWINKEIEKVFFRCPHCKKEYVSFYTDSQVREWQADVRELHRKAMVPGADTKTINKQVEALIKKQKKRQKDLKRKMKVKGH